jgi:hypothetical protein
VGNRQKYVKVERKKDARQGEENEIKHRKLVILRMRRREKRKRFLLFDE